MTQTIPKVVADFETQLAASVSVGATAATISSATDADGNLLADGTYAFTVDGGAASKEYVLAYLTAATKALSAVRNVSRVGVATAGFARAHRVGATVTVTDHAAIRNIANVLDGTTGLDSATPIFYDGAPTFSAANSIVTKQYVDSLVSGGTVLYDKQTTTGTAGETLAANDLVYFKESDQRWWKADDDTVATVAQVQLGFANGAASAGGSFNVTLSGPQPGFTGLTAGSKYYASATAGGVTTSTGANGVFVGWATSTTVLLFNCTSGLYEPTKAEKDAFAGTVGTPSSSNRFVTAEGVSAMVADQSQATQDASTACGEADATTKRNVVAQSFVANDHYLRGVTLNKRADNGTFSGSVVISVQADAAGAPSGTPLVSKTVTNAFWLRYPVGTFFVLFASEIATTKGSTYWIVVDPSTSDNANFVNLGTNSAGGYASGILRYQNTTDGWVTVSGVDLTFSTLSGLGGRAIKDSSATAGNVASAVPAIKTKLVQATVATSNTAVAHGLGKVPAFIDVCHAAADTTFGSFSRSVIDVAAGTAATNGFGYNEASTGWSVNEVAATGSTALGIAPSGWNANNREFFLSYVSCDENVAIFTRNSGSAAYAFTFTA